MVVCLTEAGQVHPEQPGGIDLPNSGIGSSGPDKCGTSEGMDKETEPETGIPVALMTSCRRAETSNGCVPPRHSNSSLTTLGPESVNTGRGRFGDNIIVRRTFRCCVDWNLT